MEAIAVISIVAIMTRFLHNEAHDFTRRLEIGKLTLNVYERLNDTIDYFDGEFCNILDGLISDGDYDFDELLADVDYYLNTGDEHYMRKYVSRDMSREEYL